MKERLIEFLRIENKSSAQLAEEIGVQPSGISHILSGRNNPSLDFVLKMVEKYKFLSTDWLLFGKGSMYKENKVLTLFDNIPLENDGVKAPVNKSEPQKQEVEIKASENKSIVKGADIQSVTESASVVRIVYFYDNNSFREYFPAGSDTK